MVDQGLVFLGATTAALILLLTPALDLVYGETPPGFLSIDCGKPKGFNYNDSDTGLSFVSDFEYIDAGEVHKVSAGSMPYRAEELFSLRSFPNGTRSCFNVRPVEIGKKYLLRTHFLHGNYGGRKLPVRFDLYVGTIFWETVVVTEPFVAQAHEIIFLSLFSTLHVCLVDTGSGTPFISDIELRPFGDKIYPEVTSYRWLSLVRRYNVGGANFLRYPYDPYDRFWWTFTGESWQKETARSRNITTHPRYETPSDVMRSAAFPPANGSSLDFSWSDKFVSPNPRGARYDVIYHFAELQELGPGEKRAFRVLRGGVPVSDDISPRYLDTTSSFSTNYTHHDLNYSIVQTNESTLPPLLNAMELYVVLDITYYETDKKDAEAITKIKELFGLKRNWMGDPCLPKNFTWEGLKCDGSMTPRITSLNLSSSGLVGEIPHLLANLTKLEYLDLSRNSLTGQIPDNLGTIKNLKLLDLSYNKLSGSVPKSIYEKAKSGNLIIRTEGNPDLDMISTKSTPNNSKTKLILIVVVVVISMLMLAVVLWVIIARRGKRHATDYENVFGHNVIDSPSIGSDAVQYPYSALEKITKNFAKEIGSGAFGTVYHGVLERDVQVAVKLLSQSSTQMAKDQFKNEAKLLRRVHHRNLVCLLGYCNDHDHLALIFEYKENGSLKDHLSGRSEKVNALTWWVRLRTATEVAQGLEYLHYSCQPAIVHRDVKSSNILLNKNWEASIADFGLSKFFQNDDLSYMSATVVGTPGYLDPEYYNTHQLNERSDVYSFGVVLLELVTGKPAIVKGSESTSLIQWVLNKLQNGDIVDIIDPRLQEDYEADSVRRTVEIAVACTAGESKRRPTMREVTALLKDCSKVTWKNDVSNQDLSSTNTETTECSSNTSIEALLGSAR